MYHDSFNPLPETVCTCGAFSEKRRADDTEQTVVARLDAYHQQTAPLADFYQASGLLHRIDGDRDIDLITADMLNALN